MEIYNHNLLQLNIKKRKNQITKYDFLYNEIAQRLFDRLEDFKDNFEVVHFHSMPLSRRPYDTSPLDFIEDMPALEVESLDVYISNSTLQFCHNMSQALYCIRHCLKPNGVYLGAMFGGDTLTEFRQAITMAEESISGGVHPRMHPMIPSYELAGLMQQSGFGLPVVDSEIINVEYNDIYGLTDDLRGMNLGNILKDKKKIFDRRELFQTADEIYQDRFSKNGKIVATFEVLFLTGQT